jgi:hypothetical protein
MRRVEIQPTDVFFETSGLKLDSEIRGGSINSRMIMIGESQPDIDTTLRFTIYDTTFVRKLHEAGISDNELDIKSVSGSLIVQLRILIT